MPRTVSLWRGRSARDGLAGLTDKLRPGPRPKYGVESGRRILAVLDKLPPAGFARWTGPPIAAELGDVHEQQVWRFLRAQQIDLDGRKSWCESQDPDFVAKAADVVGFISRHPRMRSSSVSTKSHRSRLWNGRKVISSFPTGGR